MANGRTNPNSHRAWNACDNRYWPACYLLGAGGFIRYWRFGEASPLIVELANITRDDFDFAPDELDAGGFKLDVEPSELVRLRDLQRDESGAEKAQAEFVRQEKKRPSVTKAFKKTVEMTKLLRKANIAHNRGPQGRVAVYSACGAQKDRSHKHGGMSRKANLSNRASQALIAADARLFRDLAMNSRLEPTRSSAFLALLPFLSAFAYESANYISRTDLGATRMLQPHEERRIASRMRLKLTEDKYKSSARVLENVEELIAIKSGWFLDHGGILGPVKRLLQPDVGICFMKNEAVYTTHIAFLGMGLSKDDLARSSISRETMGRHVYDRSYDIGQYVVLLLRKLNVEDYKPENSPEVRLPVEDHDMGSKALYEAAASRVAPSQPRVGG